MVASCVVVDQLKQVIGRFATIEELPHSFDDTLVDGLIGNINMSDPPVSEFVKESFQSLDFESSASMVVSLLLRLYEKYCQRPASHDAGIADQLARAEVLLEQSRPAKVLSDLFTVYTTCHRLRQQGEWENVIFWCVSHFPSDELTLFLRRKIEDFLCMTEGEDVESLIVSSMSDLFCCTDSAHVLNGTARILLHFAGRLSTHEIQLIVETVQTGGVVGDVVYQLVATVRPDMTLMDDLNPSKWNNETARCQTIIKLTQLSSNNSFQELQSYLPGICRILMDRRRAPLSDLQEMLTKLQPRLSVAELATVLDSLFPRLLESPCLLEAICKARGPDFLNDPSMANIRDRLAVEITKAISHSDWEVRDTALEIGAAVPCFRPMLGPLPPLVRFDPSPYVRAAALRCMVLDEKYHQDELPQLCENVVMLDADAEPRLVAVQYLHKTLAANIRHVFRILPKAIEDTDDEVRRLMIEMCSTLLVVEEFAEETEKELQEWTEDSEIGAAVRAVLGEPPVEHADPVEHILTDMMNALRIHFEDTIDCY
ncbi:unnamed protein product [Heligmosomoides polygyrus]|uniref:HEAT repeat-containing protein n=1 Tax=Heligmosomoides polygyrus TaxID=6339 RepID=A0A3P7ZEN6_HELPZ|nr:unnamed protein product [Heligmosomoides polygyrus]